MKSLIVVFNAGSSSLKFSVYEKESMHVYLEGEVENLFISPKLWIKNKEEKIESKVTLVPEIGAVVKVVLTEIMKITEGHKIVAFVHRVVHGGKKYKQPTVITPDVVMQLQKFIPLAPLHQPYNIDVIKICMELHQKVLQIACFDTSFHRTQSFLAQLFPLPLKYAEEGIVRYGFHGLSYQYIASVLPRYAGKKAQNRVVVAHLGNGASLCAMKELKSVSTSMGFTALDGLMMGTRTGNIDPGILLYLLAEKGFTVDTLTDLLYFESGLKGVSGISSDIRTLLASTESDAKRAIDLFCYIAAKNIGSLLPTIDGLDVMVFTAGIGENCPQIRTKICSYLTWLGLEVDEKSNAINAPKISSIASKVEIYVIPTKEEQIAAENAAHFV